MEGEVRVGNTRTIVEGKSACQRRAGGRKETGDTDGGQWVLAKEWVLEQCTEHPKLSHKYLCNIVILW